MLIFILKFIKKEYDDVIDDNYSDCIIISLLIIAGATFHAPYETMDLS